MDTAWVLAELRRFVELASYQRVPDPRGVTVMGGTWRAVGSDSEIVAQAEVVDQILQRVLPDWRQVVPANAKRRWAQRHEACIRAVAKVERQDEIERALGDSAPELSAAGMHPWVWSGARSLWQSG